MKFVISLAFSDPTHILELARAADECGFEAIAVSDHVVHPENIKTPYPYTQDGARAGKRPHPGPTPGSRLARCRR